jgi:hypothetical protein
MTATPGPVLVSEPGISNPQFGDNLSKAVCEIRAASAVQLGRRWIDDGNPIMFGGSVDRQPEFGRPPIRLALVDEGNQFRRCSLRTIDEFHGNGR